MRAYKPHKILVSGKLSTFSRTDHREISVIIAYLKSQCSRMSESNGKEHWWPPSFPCCPKE